MILNDSFMFLHWAVYFSTIVYVLREKITISFILIVTFLEHLCNLLHQINIEVSVDDFNLAFLFLCKIDIFCHTKVFFIHLTLVVASS